MEVESDIGDKQSVAVVGLGRMGVRHIEAALRVGLRISGICDLSADVVDAVGERFGVPVDRRFRSSGDLFAALRPRSVVIATTAPTHCGLTLSAIEMGAKTILCEKPMASSLGECIQMSEMARKHGAKLAINHPMRFMPKYRLARASVETGEFGPLNSIVVTGANIGLAMNVSHLFEMFQFVVGRPVATMQAWLEPDLLPNPRGAQFNDRSGRLLASDENGASLFVDFSGRSGHGLQTIFVFRDAQILVDEINGFLRVISRKTEFRGKPTSQYALATDVSTSEIPPSDPLEATAAVWRALLDGEGYPDAVAGSHAVAAVVAAHLSDENGGAKVAVKDAFAHDARRFDWA